MSTVESPIRVCFPFLGDTVGGSHLSSLLLIRHLDRSRFEPVVALHEPDGAVGDLFLKENVNFEALPVQDKLNEVTGNRLRKLGALLAVTPALMRFLRSRRIAIVHTNDLRMHLTWVAAARLSGARMICHQRSPADAAARMSAILRYANRIISISNYALEDLARTIRPSKLTVITNPFDVSGYPDRSHPEVKGARAEILKGLVCGPNARIVGFFGSLIDRKRPFLFLEAAAHIVDKLGRNLAFAVFGDDREISVADLQHKSQVLGIADQVCFMGFRYPPQRWQAACDLILAPAVREPFGRVLVEALLAGTPLIAANAGGHAGIIHPGETGWLVPPDDPVALGEQAVAVLSDRTGTAALAKRAQAAAAQRYSVKRHVTKVMAIYDEVLGNAPAGPAEAS